PTTDRVHPTPIYEAVVAVLIGWYLWRLGAKALRGPRAVGEAAAEYFIWMGVERFLVEFIRINPRSVFGVMSNAQAAALASVAVGAGLLVAVRRGFRAEKG